MNPIQPSDHHNRLLRGVSRIAALFRTLPPWALIAGAALFMSLFSLFIVWANLSESLLHLGIIPIVLAALYQERRIVYLGCSLVLILIALWTARQLSDNFGESLKTITLSGLVTLLLSETLFTLSASRRQAETALRESEARYRAIFDASLNAMSINEPPALGGRYVQINDAYTHVTGYRRDQLIGKSPLELGFWHNIQQHNDLVATLERDGIVSGIEAELRLGNGHIITGLISARMVSLGNQPYLLSVVYDISERKRALESLRQSQAQLQAILSSVPMILWAIDGNGRFILVEGNALASTGIRPEKVVGRSIWDFYAENQDGAHASFVHEIQQMLNDKTLNITHTIHNVIFESRLVPFFDPASQTNGAIIVSIDITEREKAQAAQRELATLLDATLNAIPDIIGIQGPDYEIIRYNEAGYRSFNTMPQETFGKKCYELSGYTSPCAMCATREAYRTKAPAQIERYEPSTDIWLDVRAYPILDEQGKVVGMIEHLRDITAQKKAEQALQASQQFLQDVFDAIRDGISVLDTDLNILQVNHWMETLYQNMMPLVGKKCFVVYQQRDSRCPWCPTAKTLETGEPHTEIVPYPSADAPTGWIELSTFPIKDANGRVVRIIEYVKDITARVLAEQEKERLQERLMHAQKMEAIGRLAGGIAHDFNNMLTAIQGYTEFLLQACADDAPEYRLPAAQIHADLGEVMAAANRAQSLTQQLLAFSRKQILQPQVINISETLSSMERMLRPLLGEDIYIYAHLAPGGDYVQADPGQIEQIVMNLAVNARDAMPNGGQLTFEVINLTLDEEFAHHRPGLHAGDYVQLSISDTGVGMSDEIKAHLFEPFFTTKEKGKGTGLGLATVYAIVEQLGGYISVYSEVGIGSTFKIYLPRAARPEESKGESTSDTPMPSGSETILLTEDEEMVRTLIHRVLSRCGYTVLTAERSVEALALAQAHHGPIDLLITDVVMPEMGGKELATRLLETHPEARVLFISGYTDNAIVHHGVLDPGIHFIQKPFVPHRLAAQVRKILDEKRS